MAMLEENQEKVGLEACLEMKKVNGFVAFMRNFSHVQVWKRRFGTYIEVLLM
ncbi:hypothetical protein ACSBR2_038052 [Camellia fascicularis]